MHTRGVLAPETEAAVRDRYDDLGLAAQVVVKESAKAMGFDGEEYRERVTGDVVATGRDALFASLLSVSVGTRAEFDDWLTDHEDVEVAVEGSEHVERVVWHCVPFADAVVAATFQHEEDAAVATLRRMAFARLYLGVLSVD